MDLGGGPSGGEKWWGAGYILKEKPIGFFDGLDVSVERKRGAKDDTKENTRVSSRIATLPSGACKN